MLAGALLLTLLGNVEAGARRPEVEAFFRPSEVSRMQISPDGKSVAFIHPRDDEKGLVICDLRTGEMLNVEGTSSYDVSELWWAGNDHVIFKVVEGNIYASGLCSAHRETGKVEILNRGDALRVIDPLPDSPDEVLVWIVDAVQGRQRLLKYGVSSGFARSVNLKVPKGKVLDWYTDRDGEVIMVETYEDETSHLWRRDSTGEGWQEVKLPASVPINRCTIFRYDTSRGQYWVAGYLEGADTGSLHTFNLATSTLSPTVHQDSEFDIIGNASMVYSRKRDTIVGLRYNQKGPTAVWFDPAFKEAQRVIDASFPGTMNVIRDFDENEERMVVYSYSDKVPGMWSVVDLKERAIHLKLESKP